MQLISCGLHFSFYRVTDALIIQLVKLHKKKMHRLIAIQFYLVRGDVE